MTDPLHILVQAFASALIAHGHPPMPAYMEAEELTLGVLEQMQRAGAPLGHLLLRVRIYDMRSRGMDTGTVMQRLGVSRIYIHKAYKKELFRRRYAA